MIESCVLLRASCSRMIRQDHFAPKGFRAQFGTESSVFRRRPAWALLLGRTPPQTKRRSDRGWNFLKTQCGFERPNLCKRAMFTFCPASVAQRDVPHGLPQGQLPYNPCQLLCLMESARRLCNSIAVVARHSFRAELSC